MDHIGKRSTSDEGEGEGDRFNGGTADEDYGISKKVMLIRNGGKSKLCVSEKEVIRTYTKGHQKLSPINESDREEKILMLSIEQGIGEDEMILDILTLRNNKDEKTFTFVMILQSSFSTQLLARMVIEKDNKRTIKRMMRMQNKIEGLVPIRDDSDPDTVVFGVHDASNSSFTVGALCFNEEKYFKMITLKHQFGTSGCRVFSSRCNQYVCILEGNTRLHYVRKSQFRTTNSMQQITLVSLTPIEWISISFKEYFHDILHEQKSYICALSTDRIVISTTDITSLCSKNVHVLFDDRDLASRFVEFVPGYNMLILVLGYDSRVETHQYFLEMRDGCITAARLRLLHTIESSYFGIYSGLKVGAHRNEVTRTLKVYVFTDKIVNKGVKMTYKFDRHDERVVRQEIEPLGFSGLAGDSANRTIEKPCSRDYGGSKNMVLYSLGRHGETEERGSHGIVMVQR